MKSFPLLIFTGFAPLFAIMDQVKEKKSFWNFFELILLALCTSLFCAYLFDTNYIVPVLIQGILFTLSFVGYSYARRQLGSWLVNFFIILFWLGIEYLLLKLSWPKSILFLADAVQLKTEWLRWTPFTGYLGASCWILLCNFILYMALLRSEKINPALVGLYLLLLAGPIIYSYTLPEHTISRSDMISLYNHVERTDSAYTKRGEYIPRTAAFLAGLILIFAIIKQKPERND